jgi:hypothetical protein
MPVLKPSATKRLDLEAVGVAGYYFVEDGVDEEAEDQTRDEAGHDDDGERLLRVAANAGGHGGGKQAEAGNESGHHDGARAEKSSFAGGFADGAALDAQLIDVADENDGDRKSRAEC